MDFITIPTYYVLVLFNEAINKLSDEISVLTICYFFTIETVRILLRDRCYHWCNSLPLLFLNLLCYWIWTTARQASHLILTLIVIVGLGKHAENLFRFKNIVTKGDYKKYFTIDVFTIEVYCCCVHKFKSCNAKTKGKLMKSGFLAFHHTFTAGNSVSITSDWSQYYLVP